jgi:hypothetical protein
MITIMSQGKKRMKIALITAIVLVVLLVAVSSIYSTGKLNPISENDVTVTNNNSNTNVTTSGSASNNAVEPNPSQASESTGEKSVKDLAPASGILPNASTSGSSNDQSNPKPAEDETATGNVTPPDGRIYTGGEEPYAYLPTCSQKAPPLPIIPLEPND